MRILERKSQSRLLKPSTMNVAILFDGAEKQTYTQEKGLTFLEKYREGFEKQYSKSTFGKVLIDGNTLVRFYSHCNGARFKFFNIEHRLFITLDFVIGKKFPNPNYKYESKS